MKLTDSERIAVVKLQLDKAYNTFQQIALLKEAGYWDNIANRLYYALYHAVCGLLINDGYSISSHRGVVGLFGKHYILTGIFSIDDGKHYSRLQGLRERSDYNCAYTATEEEISPKIEPTKKLIDKIYAYIYNP